MVVNCLGTQHYHQLDYFDVKFRRFTRFDVAWTQNSTSITSPLGPRRFPPRIRPPLTSISQPYSPIHHHISQLRSSLQRSLKRPQTSTALLYPAAFLDVLKLSPKARLSTIPPAQPITAPVAACVVAHPHFFGRLPETTHETTFNPTLSRNLTDHLLSSLDLVITIKAFRHLSTSHSTSK